MALRRTGLRFTPTIYAGLTTSNVIADDIDVRAEVTPKVTAHGYGVNSGALSVGVSKATVTISPTVSAVAGGTINARTLDVEAMTRTPSTGSTATAKTTGSAGGLIGIDATRTTITHGGTVSSETIIAFDTKVSIGDNAILTGQGTEASPGEFALRAVNDIRAVDKISFVTGGALSGAGAYSTIKPARPQRKGDLASVVLGTSTTLTNPGDILISARGTGDVSTKSNAETYVVATVAIAETRPLECSSGVHRGGGFLCQHDPVKRDSSDSSSTSGAARFRRSSDREEV